MMTAPIGPLYLSAAGRQSLAELRLGPPLAQTGGAAPIQLLARVPSEDCECPEELWRFDGLELLFHFEADGTSDAHIFAGDWERETTLRARSLDDLRAKAFQWMADVFDGVASEARDT